MSEEILVTREPIKLDRLDIIEAITNFKNEGLNYPTDMRMINIRGTNGSGKSTIPLQMLANDRAAYMLTLEGKDIATVFPSYNFVALGKYKNKTGGLDGVSTTADMKNILSLVHFLPYSILLEGVLASTVYSTYADLFLMYQDKAPKRKVGILNILPPFENIKSRVLNRNGGKEVKWEQLESKWRTVHKNVQKFKDVGLVSWEADNSGIQINETLDWFFEQINANVN